MSAAAAMPVISVLVFAGAATAAIATIAAMIAPQWRRIVRLATGHPEANAGPDERWRRVHIEGDRRRPYIVVNAAASRHGWLNRRVR